MRAEAPPLRTRRWLVGLVGLVLVVYDTALLYSLGRLAERLPAAVACTFVMFACRAAQARQARGGPRGPGPAVTFAGAALRRWLAPFLVPALAVRYGVTFGTPQLAAGAGVLAASLAGVRAVGDAARTTGTPWGKVLRHAVYAVTAGTLVAFLAGRLGSGRYHETALLSASGAFLVTTLGACALVDALTSARQRGKVRDLLPRATSSQEWWP